MNVFVMLLMGAMAGRVSGQGCGICDDGQEVGDPDALIAIPGQPIASCDQLEQAGKDGLIPWLACSSPPQFILETCDCRPIGAAPSFVRVPTPSPAVPPATYAICNVCGDGQEVRDPDALFIIPGQPTVSCDRLEQRGKDGRIPWQSCSFLPQLILEICDCRPIGAAPSFVREPTPSPVPPPPPPPAAPPATYAVCNVCGDGKEVGNPDALFIIPGQPIVSCDRLEQRGKDGRISEQSCSFIPQLTPLDMCNCRPIIDGEAPSVRVPTPPSAPSPASVPTPAPMMAPTSAPSPVELPSTVSSSSSDDAMTGKKSMMGVSSSGKKGGKMMKS